MRMLGLTLLAAATALSACAGPADPATDPPLAYRTGSRIKQPDEAQPNLVYYGPDQLSRSTSQTVGSAIAHGPPTPVPPPPQ
jgi:hypothetical protein